jgi:hypothetical protein
MRKHFEQLRVGVRKGMMWWGSLRLAESAYESAVAEMNKSTPNRSKALWYLDCATNLNPQFSEAIQMKQDLTGKELSEVDNSTVRWFVRDEIMKERANSSKSSSTGTNWSDDMLTEPTTQPTDLTRASAFTPASETRFEPSTQPATQPSHSSSKFDLSLNARPEDFTPATQPSTAPSLTESDPAWESEWSNSAMFGGFGRMLSAKSSSTSPATQPSDSKETTITELPTEEITPATGGDHNK